MPPRCTKMITLLVDGEEVGFMCVYETGHTGTCRCTIKKLNNDIQKISVLEDRMEIEWI